jgi:hypothetical protein
MLIREDTNQGGGKLNYYKPRLSVTTKLSAEHEPPPIADLQ